MTPPLGNKQDKELSKKHITSTFFLKTNLHNLKADCENCFGLCCVALYFGASEGFPVDKAAGKPCFNLLSDFRCSVHKTLWKKGLKGCTAFDCFGAGQKVSQITYDGHDWRQVPKSAKQMFEVFLIMRQFHEMMWYLTETLTLEPAQSIQEELSSLLNKTELLTNLNPDLIIGLDVAAHRADVNTLLLKTSELVRTEICQGQKITSNHQKTNPKRSDFIGADLRRTNLRGANLRGSCLIAADLRGVDLTGTDLIGADMRDADLRGTNLKHSIFLTQAQINTAKGDSETKLPMSLIRPEYWLK
jgi:uncharacterized protein YjbI with pentapeptide repeats